MRGIHHDDAPGFAHVTLNRCGANARCVKQTTVMQNVAVNAA
jgi:hypothetical protein